MYSNDFNHASLIDTEIINVLEPRGTCPLSTLRGSLPGYTWNYVVAAVDRLTLQGRLIVSRHGRFDYLVSLAPSLRAIGVDYQFPSVKGDVRG